MTPLPPITSSKNPLIQRAIRLHQAKGRKKEQAILLEGPNAIEQALNTSDRWTLTHLFIPDNSTPSHLAGSLSNNTVIQPVSIHVMAALSTTDSAPPIAAIATENPEYTPWHWQQVTSNTPTLLILDHIQDPGNVGTLIRSAVAFGLDGIILTGECADSLSPKVIRSSASHSICANITLSTLSLAETLCELNDHFSNSLRLWGTCGERTPTETLTTPLSSQVFDPTCGHAIVLGNEGQGLSTEILTQVPNLQWLTIPTQQVESLNVAISGSIIAYVLSQSVPAESI